MILGLFGHPVSERYLTAIRIVAFQARLRTKAAKEGRPGEVAFAVHARKLRPGKEECALIYVPQNVFVFKVIRENGLRGHELNPRSRSQQHTLTAREQCAGRSMEPLM